MGEKSGIDDLASLFLPDLLNPLANTNDISRLEMEEDIYPFPQEDPSMVSTSTNPGPGMHKLYNSGQQTSSQPDINFSAVGDVPQPYSMMNQGPISANNMVPYSNGDSYNNHFAGGRVFSPYPEIDYGHFPHHTDFISAQPDLSQQLRHRQPHIMTSQPGLQPSMSPYDAHVWPMDSQNIPRQGNMRAVDGYQPYYGQDPAMGDFQNGNIRQGDPGIKDKRSVNPIAKKNQPVDPSYKLGNSKDPIKPLSMSETKTKAPKESPQINVDFSPESIIKLLDLKQDQSAKDVFNHPAVSLGGFLRGRLLTNNEDNYKYISVTSGSVDPTRVYPPSVISCYRRNYINLYLRCTIDLAKIPQYNNESVQRFKIVILAQTDAYDPSPITFSIMSDSKAKKDFGKVGDNLLIKMIDPVHIIELNECQGDQYFLVKKLKFTSATANSTHFSFQTYNQLCVRLYAQYPSGEQLVGQTISSSLIVRGRNPSFYHSKHDNLIKPRSPHYKSSFDASFNLIDDTPDNTTHQEEVEPDDIAGIEIERGASKQGKGIKEDSLQKMGYMAGPSSDTRKDFGVKDLESAQENMGLASRVKAERSDGEITGNPSDDEVDNDDNDVGEGDGADDDGDGDGDDDANGVDEDDVDDVDDSEKDRDIASDSGCEEGGSARDSSDNLRKTKNDSSLANTQNETNLEKILSKMSKSDGESYHYFPISSVYYLPPINVVYFPHGAHHTEPAEDAAEQANKDPDSIASPLSQTQGERKNSSKVYFR